METALGIIGIAGICVSTVLLIATIGLRQTMRAELEAWAREFYISKERRAAEQTFVGQVMEANMRLQGAVAETRDAYSKTVDQVNEALSHQNMMVKSALESVRNPRNLN